MTLIWPVFLPAPGHGEQQGQMGMDQNMGMGLRPGAPGMPQAAMAAYNPAGMPSMPHGMAPGMNGAQQMYPGMTQQQQQQHAAAQRHTQGQQQMPQAGQIPPGYQQGSGRSQRSQAYPPMSRQSSQQQAQMAAAAQMWYTSAQMQAHMLQAGAHMQQHMAPAQMQQSQMQQPQQSAQPADGFGEELSPSAAASSSEPQLRAQLAEEKQKRERAERQVKDLEGQVAKFGQQPCTQGLMPHTQQQAGDAQLEPNPPPHVLLPGTQPQACAQALYGQPQYAQQPHGQPQYRDAWPYPMLGAPGQPYMHVRIPELLRPERPQSP